MEKKWKNFREFLDQFTEEQKDDLGIFVLIEMYESEGGDLEAEDDLLVEQSGGDFFKYLELVFQEVEQ